jgi:V8-like Glu-specific endopeptidase
MRTATVLLVMSLAGCVTEPDLGVDEGDVTTERLNQVEVVSRRYLLDHIARVSYAQPRITAGCSGAMIGPTTFMTAAHCGPRDNHTIEFIQYREEGRTAIAQTKTRYTCHWLVQTFGDSDLSLYDCPPTSPNGLGPGDVFGYLDFAPGRPAAPSSVYSVWWNPLGSDGGADHSFYSPGVVDQVNDNGWWVPDAAPNTGIFTTTWTEVGASGSPQLDAATHRIVVGPTTEGGLGPGRSAASSYDLFTSAVVPTTEPCVGCPTRNVARLSALGLNPANYLGRVDKGGDRVFDVQADLEDQRGEGVRDLYWLGFDSVRRNRLWQTTGVTFDPLAGTARINLVAANPTAVLRHTKLRGLTAAGEYRVRLTIDVARSGPGTTLTLALRRAGVAQASAAIPVGVGRVTHTLALSPNQAIDDLAFVLHGDLDARLSAITVHRAPTGAFAGTFTNNFDTADERLAWSDGTIGLSTPILPDGVNASASTVDWAGRNARPLIGRGIPFVAGRSQRLCFRYRSAGVPGALPPIATWGNLSLRSGATTWTSVQFQPTSAWRSLCTAWVTPTTSDVMPHFGQFGSLLTYPGAQYLVDAVQLQTR